MGKVITGASVSLDGYIAGPNETGFEHLFAWYEAGTNEFPSTHEDVRFSLAPADHRYFREWVGSVGVLVVGRHLFDLTDGWGGIHPLDRPVVVVSHSVPLDWVRAHPDAPFTFVTDGIASAIAVARGIAGDRNVGVTAGQLARQCLELGLLDEIGLDLVPVVLGGGRSFFDGFDAGSVVLDGPSIIEGERVTHLRYAVRPSSSAGEQRAATPPGSGQPDGPDERRSVIPPYPPTMTTLDDVARAALAVPGVASAALFAVASGSSDLELVAAAGIEGPPLAALVSAVRNPLHPVARAMTDRSPTYNVQPTNPGGPALRSHLPLGGRGVLALAHELPLDDVAQQEAEALAASASALIRGDMA